MDKESNELLDETIIKWIDANKDHLQSMYESYLKESKESECTLEEYAVYLYYEYGH